MLIEITYNVTDVYMSTTETPVYVEISFEQPGGGAAVWGSITGTLSNQTDLQNALNAKFDDPTGDTTQYIAGDGSLVAFPITGQAGTLVREVRNNSGATITKGTVVYINGASGNRPTIAKAIATGDATSAQTFGLIQADIANNANGYIVAFGDLDGLDTSAFTEGAQLYLSSTVLGGYTAVKQYAPNHLVYIGVVTRSHPTQGRIEVRIQNGYEMDEIHDVSAQTPSNNDGLFYNTTTSLWENKSITTALGFTPVPTTRNITINGVTFDLSADRTYTIAAGISGSGASGQVTYWTGASAVSGSNNLFWDNTNGRLGIGTNSPISTLTVSGNLTGSTSYNLILANGTVQTGVTSSASYYFTSASTQAASFNLTSLRHYIAVQGTFGAGSTVATQSGFVAHSSLIGASNNYGFYGLIPSGGGRFNLYMEGTADNYLAGNLGIGVTPSVRLQVAGDTLLRGSGATSATTALTVQNSSSTNLFTVRNDGLATISNITTTETQIQVGGASGGIGSFTTPAIKFGNTVTGIYTDNNRVFFVSNGTFGGGFASGYYQGNHVWISAAANSNDLNTPKLGAYRLNAVGLAAGLAGNSAGDVSLATNTLGRLIAKYTGQIRFVPLASAPSGAEAGDVYYDSTLNKLRVYTTAWETITSI